jgi:hypothetical protein
MQILRPCFLSVCALLFLFVSGSQGRAESAAPDSPFLPGNAPAPDAHAGSNEPFQLVGIGVVGDKVSVCIYDAAEKRSRWIAVGQHLGDLEVVSCDVEAEKSVIRIGKESKTLTLPKPTVSAAASAPAAAGADASATSTTATATVAVAANATEEDQAREARMFVTDLLEIGMQQRKAYEEAQRKAAEETEKPPTAAN